MRIEDIDNFRKQVEAYQNEVAEFNQKNDYIKHLELQLREKIDTAAKRILLYNDLEDKLKEKEKYVSVMSVKVQTDASKMVDGQKSIEVAKIELKNKEDILNKREKEIIESEERLDIEKKSIHQALSKINIDKESIKGDREMIEKERATLEEKKKILDIKLAKVDKEKQRIQALSAL